MKILNRILAALVAVTMLGASSVAEETEETVLIEDTAAIEITEMGCERSNE